MNGKELTHFFLRKKPVMMLVGLNKDEKLRYASVLAKEVDCTYSHTVRILQMLDQKGLITFDKKGRMKIIKLTNLGKEIALTLERLYKLFNKSENQ